MKQFLFIICSSLLLYSCRSVTGSGNVVTEKRQVGSFTEISASGGVDVEIKNGTTLLVEVEADDNLIEYIVTKVENGVLKIRTRDVNVINGHLKIYVTAPVINKIKASGGADVKVKDVITSKGELTFNASGGGSISVNAEAPEVNADASSGSTIELSGNTKNYTASVSSGASIKSSNLLSEDTDVSASSGSSAHVHASIHLKASASSGSNIYYHGSPSINQSISSGGSLEKED